MLACGAGNRRFGAKWKTKTAHEVVEEEREDGPCVPGRSKK